MREWLLGCCFIVLSSDLPVGTVVHDKQRCCLQDEDAEGHVCDVAREAEEEGGRVGETADLTEFLQLYAGTRWINIR